MRSRNSRAERNRIAIKNQLNPASFKTGTMIEANRTSSANGHNPAEPGVGDHRAEKINV